MARKGLHVVELSYPVTLELIYDNPRFMYSGYYPDAIFVDSEGQFYEYNSSIDVYFLSWGNNYWGDVYRNHYHDSNLYCGHRPLFNIFKSPKIIENDMRLATHEVAQSFYVDYYHYNDYIIYIDDLYYDDYYYPYIDVYI